MPTCDTITNLDDVVNAAIIKTTVFVGEELLKDHAILLPSVHDSFTSYMLRNSSQQQTWKVRWWR